MSDGLPDELAADLARDLAELKDEVARQRRIREYESGRVWPSPPGPAEGTAAWHRRKQQDERLLAQKRDAEEVEHRYRDALEQWGRDWHVSERHRLEVLAKNEQAAKRAEDEQEKLQRQISKLREEWERHEDVRTIGHRDRWNYPLKPLPPEPQHTATPIAGHGFSMNSRGEAVYE